MLRERGDNGRQANYTQHFRPRGLSRKWLAAADGVSCCWVARWDARRYSPAFRAARRARPDQSASPSPWATASMK
jgi:hypothetical protein